MENMIDLGQYEIQKSEVTGEYLVTEMMTGRTVNFNSLHGVFVFIEQDVKEVMRENNIEE